MVFRCPSTSKAIFEQTRKSGCDQTLQYHCMRTQSGGLIEKCLEISWIQEGNCAIFNSNAKQVDAVKCNENLGICPQKQYLSNEVMSYSACVQIPETPSVSTVRNEKNYSAQSFTSALPTEEKPFDFQHTQLLMWILISVAILSVVAIVVCFIYRRRKRSAQGSGAFHGNDEEMKPLDNSTESNKNLSEIKVPKNHGSGAFYGNNEEMMPLDNSTESDKNPGKTKVEKHHELDTYYKTRTYEYLEKLIGDSAVSIFIVGEPGSGKSVLVEMLHRRFQRQTVNGKYYISQYLKSLEDIDENTIEHEDPSQENPKMIYIIDDCFEIWEQYPDLATANLKELQVVHERFVIGKGNYLVITISKRSIYKNLKATEEKLKEYDMLEIVDLSSKDFDLDIADKTGILEYHRTLKGSTSQRMGDEALRKLAAPSTIQSIVSYLSVDAYFELQFPLSCCLFYIHDSFEEKGELFFIETKKKTKYFVEKLSRGSQVEKCQYCTLIYIALHGGKINALKGKDGNLLKNIANEAKIDVSDVDFNFDCCLIIKGKDDTYQIVHAEITRQLFRVFGYVHRGFVIENCEAEVLLEFIRTDDDDRRAEYRQKGFLIITHDLYPLLSAKLSKMDSAIQTHIIFKDASFYEIFREAKGNSLSKI